MLLLLVIIYLAFISLGLPDAILGSAWPIMSKNLNASLEFAGAVSLVISLGTVISSLMTAKLINQFGIGKVVAFSVLLTASALLGFSMANFALALMLLAIPLGIGAGAVDAALNNYVAQNYESKHMNYLHSFWGVGATAGPLIMANYLMLNEGWRQGYMAITLIQFALVIILFASLPLWKKALSAKQEEAGSTPFISNRKALGIFGVKIQLVMFFCYCALEAGTGLWTASYLSIEKGLSPKDAAFWTAMFYLGITAGRFLCGFVSGKVSGRFADKLNEESLIRLGVITIILGVIVLISPLPILLSPIGLMLIGLGCAPIYPNTIHLTPKRFGASASQAVIGLSMACAYIGTTLVPPIIGALVSYFSFALYPALLLLLALGLLITTEKLKRLCKSANMETAYNSNNEHL
ncbi:MFS transporter [Marinomonas sp. PE14-40]|uniref:MFS transporter n=1 Tax=Marinomonas sp. PE14-40 TaxID=3060621 RepID=UPI003F6785D2